MRTPDIKAYNGTEKYIFISYSHKDKEKVYPFISALQERYNVWFDEGIHYGQEWEKEIVMKLRGCSILIFVITGNSLESENCMDELYHARALGKNFINVIIERDVQLPEWFNFRYGRYQMCCCCDFSSYGDAISDLERKCDWFKEAGKNSPDSSNTKVYVSSSDKQKKSEPEPEITVIEVEEKTDNGSEEEKKRCDALERAKIALEMKHKREVEVRAKLDAAKKEHPEKPADPDVCSKCGKKLPKEALFCTACGTKRSSDPVKNANCCENCGAKIQPGALFCTSCGKRICLNGGK